MSVPVSLDRLREALADFGAAPLLLTVSDGDRPHAVAVAPRWVGDDLAAEVGRRTVANALERPHVSLVWPAVAEGGYTLIVDGSARLAPSAGHAALPLLLVTPSKAVLHRAPAAPASGAADSPDACTADCIPLTQP